MSFKQRFKHWFTNPFVLLLLIDVVVSNVWVFWDGVDSKNPIFSTQQGMVDWWVFDLSRYIRALLLPIAMIIQSIKPVIISRKMLWLFVIYGIMQIKDVFDYLQQGNQTGLGTDIVVFLVSIVVCDAISEVMEKK